MKADRKSRHMQVFLVYNSLYKTKVDYRTNSLLGTSEALKIFLNPQKNIKKILFYNHPCILQSLLYVLCDMLWYMTEYVLSDRQETVTRHSISGVSRIFFILGASEIRWSEKVWLMASSIEFCVQTTHVSRDTRNCLHMVTFCDLMSTLTMAYAALINTHTRGKWVCNYVYSCTYLCHMNMQHTYRSSLVLTRGNW